MHTPQSGIFALGTASHTYLEFDLKHHADPRELLRIVADLRGPRATTGGVNLVVGFAPELWADLAPDDAPDKVQGFHQEIQGPDGFSLPATQHDLWIWIAGHAYDKIFDTTAEAMKALAPVASLADETDGWTYKENRDLTGFIDGTENPSLSEAPEVAIVPDGHPGAGGSVVLVQKWIQHASEWEALQVEEQERVMGRTKADSIEIPDEVREPSSHVSRTVIEQDGQELDIFRRNTPFGTPRRHGTMFIGFCANQDVLHRMLLRMAGVEDGIRDALTHYTSALTGAYYFVPSVESLRDRGASDGRF